MIIDQKVLDRFWEKVNIKGSDECWEWIASKATGYGLFSYRGRLVTAHRFIWELSNGLIPKGGWICHTCDNKLCVNPNHLYLGDRASNARDAITRGQQARGERMGSSKLTNKDAIRIRKEYETGKISQSKLGKENGVTQQTVCSLLSRETWKHI